MTENDFEADLTGRLASLAGFAPDEPSRRPDAVGGAEPSGRRRRWALVGVAAVVVAGLIVAAVALVDSDPTDVTSVGPVDSPDVTSPSETPGGLWADVGRSWVQMPAGLADGRGLGVSVWTGTELIVWGGEIVSGTTFSDRGSRFDPLTGRWTAMAESPLSARSEHVGVWTGAEMIVCCGVDNGGTVGGAAAYDPAADSWRRIAEPPFRTGLGVAVWTGTEMIVTGGIDNGGETAHRQNWAYDPASDEWSELAPPPHVIERAANAAWTGEVMIVWPHTYGSSPGMVYDRGRDEWERLPFVPTGLDPWGASMVWTGSEIIIWGIEQGATEAAVGARLEMGSDTWAPIGDAPIGDFDWWEGVPGSNSAVWTGTEMIVWAGSIGVSPQTAADGGPTRTLAYDPQTDSWRELDDAETYWGHPHLIWTGEVVLAVADHLLAIRPDLGSEALNEQERRAEQQAEEAARRRTEQERERDLGPEPVAPTTTIPSGEESAVFGGPESQVTLVFDDGYDGVVAVDLNDRVAARWVLPGQRAGDQPVRLHAVGDRLVVGWSPVVSITPTGEDLIDLGGTIFVPAAEDDAVWVIDYGDDRIGPGPTTFSLVSTTTGGSLVEAPGIDGSEGMAAAGVPGGLIVSTDDGIGVWTPEAAGFVRMFSDETGFVATANQNTVAWCSGDCSTMHLSDAQTGTRVDVAAQPGATFAAHAVAVSPDGKTIAAVEITGGSAEVVTLADATTGNVAARYSLSMGFPAAVVWSPDSTQLFVAEDSYGRSATALFRLDIPTETAEIVELAFGGALGAITGDPDLVTTTDAPIGDISQCGPPTAQPSGRTAPCRFEF